MILEWGEWSSCKASCKRTRTRICEGGDECAECQVWEEKCTVGLCNQGMFIIWRILVQYFYKFRKIFAKQAGA